MAGRQGLGLLASALARRAQLASLCRLPHGLQVAGEASAVSRGDAEHGGTRARSPLALLCGAAAAAAFASSAQVAFADTAEAGAAPAPYTPEQASTSGSGAYRVPPERRGLPKEVILYQYEVCPFCCKVKAFLDYHKIPYRTVEVSPLTKSELKWGPFRKVPVAVLDGEPLADSSAIVSRLAAEAGPRPPVQGGAAAPAAGGWASWRRKGQAEAAPLDEAMAAREEEERWRRWTDERFVRLITVNIYRSMRESFQMFDYIADTGRFNLVEREATRVAGAMMMWGISGRMRKKYGISGDVRQELFAAGDEWVAALGDRSFMGGDAPNLADLAVFGVTRSVTCTDTFNELMHSTGIGPWYIRMIGAVGQSSRVSTS